MRRPLLHAAALALLLAGLVGCGTAERADPPPAGTGGAEPLVIAHRGASGYRPEHTLAAYRLAIEQGADYIEPDLVPTADGVMVVRHSNDITATTDVARHPELADRRAVKRVGGRTVTGWFTEDLTLAELRTLRAVEPEPADRPESARYSGRYPVVTFEEFLRFAAGQERRTGHRIRIAPELKTPAYFEALGLPVVGPTLRLLARYGYDERPRDVLLQSFDAGTLRRLDRTTPYPLVRLVGEADRDRLTPGGLTGIATYADWLGPAQELVREAPEVVADAHDAGLEVVVWSLRSEDGDVAAATQRLLEGGVDAVFADEPDLAVAGRDAWLG